MFFELIKFIGYSALIVIISKYILVTTLRRLAENLSLKPQTVGDIAGYATSVPELLTIITSSVKGLMSTSIFNILSSNVINLIQYLTAIILNKNRRALLNRAIQVDIFMVLLTIIIPVLLIGFNIQMGVFIVPIFIILYVFFKFLNNNVHKLYLKKEDEILAKQIEEEEKLEIGNTRKTLLYVFYLAITGILLYVIGDALGSTLESLARNFNVSEIVLGILLGFTTSIPELITFFESQRHYKNEGNNDILGVVEATNNLLTSNILNLFVIQSIGLVIFSFFNNL